MVSRSQRDFGETRHLRKSNYPLLRINSRYLDREFRGLDLPTCFVDVWFLQEAFEGATNSAVPYDEPSVMKLGGPHEVSESSRSDLKP